MKKITLLTCLLFLFLAFSPILNAQIAHGGEPYSLNNANEISLLADVPSVKMASFDLEQMQKEDELLYSGKDQPYRFGKEFEVNLTLENSGKWETLPNGDRIWRLKINSPNAKSINLEYSHYKLPEGGKLFLHNPSYSSVLGSFTDQNNKPYQKFSTGFVKGETTILEYYEPAAVAGQGIINISKVVHAYRVDFFDALKGYGDSGSCNIDVNCETDPIWQNSARSVAMIFNGGTRWCTGATINNTAQDGTPYFLTAHHCADTDVNFSLTDAEIAQAETWMFVFNYQSDDCVTGLDGELDQSISGAIFRAANSSPDFLLLELSSPPPSSYNVYMAGWNRADVPSSSTVCIHHPTGDVKKISYDDNTVVDEDFFDLTFDTHWQVTQWESGTTEGGSSGSPLFDNTGKIIGTLSGGTASCNAPQNPDNFGKMAYSWDLGNTPATRLEDWLNPNNSTAVTLDGMNHEIAELDMAIGFLNAIDEALSCNTEISPTFELKNNGATAITAATIDFDLDGNSETYQWSGNLASGASDEINLGTLPLTTGSGIHNFTVNITNVNGQTDNNTANNSKTQSFETINGLTFEVVLNLDDWASEQSYQITNSNGEVLYIKDNFTDFSTDNAEYCLELGCYNLTLFDSWGDGFSGPGNIELTFNNEVLVNISGEDFGNCIANTQVEGGCSETVEFCLESDNNAPIIAFGVSKTDACKEETITFSNNTQSSSPATYTWTFEGGTPETSNEENPNVTYSTEGVYNVTLKVNNTEGEFVLTQPDYITINAIPQYSVNAEETTAGGSITIIPNDSNADYGYAWSNGATNNQIVDVPMDVYSVTITDNKTGCNVVETVDLTNLGIDDIDYGFAISPNPAKDVLNIEHLLDGTHSIEIYDNTGKLMQTDSFEGKQASIDINKDLATGLYFVKIMTDGKVAIQKVLIDK